jgi:hypothetical protein
MTGKIERKSAVLQEAGKLLDKLAFDPRYGTHVRGENLSLSVIITSQPADGKVRGFVACHAFAHAEVEWSRLEAMIDSASPEPHFLDFGEDGTTKSFEIVRDEKMSYHLYAWVKPESLEEEEIGIAMAGASFSDPNAPPPRPVRVNSLPIDPRIQVSVIPSKTTAVNLLFETNTEDLGEGSVVFSFRSGYGTPAEHKLVSAHVKFEESLQAGRWIALWTGQFEIPEGTEVITLVYAPWHAES